MLSPATRASLDLVANDFLCKAGQRRSWRTLQPLKPPHTHQFLGNGGSWSGRSKVIGLWSEILRDTFVQFLSVRPNEARTGTTALFQAALLGWLGVRRSNQAYIFQLDRKSDRARWWAQTPFAPRSLEFAKLPPWPLVARPFSPLKSNAFPSVKRKSLSL